jgi:Zn-finger protein
MEHSFKYFRNAACEYFPCHKVDDEGFYNCLFCYCPLYFLKDCGGSPSYTHSGIKNCTPCSLPHCEGGYEHILQRLRREFDDMKSK